MRVQDRIDEIDFRLERLRYLIDMGNNLSILTEEKDELHRERVRLVSTLGNGSDTRTFSELEDTTPSGVVPTAVRLSAKEKLFSLAQRDGSRIVRRELKDEHGSMGWTIDPDRLGGSEEEENDRCEGCGEEWPCFTLDCLDCHRAEEEVTASIEYPVEPGYRPQSKLDWAKDLTKSKPKVYLQDQYGEEFE